MSSDVTAADESKRLAAVRQYCVPGIEHASALDRVTTLVSRLLHVPIAVISTVDASHIRFISRRGLEIDEVERGRGLCASVITDAAPVVVEDTTADPVSRENPLVAGESAVRFYAGVPLTAPDGHTVGTLAVMDHSPRRVGEEDLATLQDLASLTMDLLELHVLRHGARDEHDEVPLTTAARTSLRHEGQEDSHDPDGHDGDVDLNTSFRPVLPRVLEGEIAAALERASTGGTPVALFVIEIVQPNSANGEHGAMVGEQVVEAVARRLGAVIRKEEVLSRIGDSEFALLCPDVPSQGAAESIGIRLRAELGKSADRSEVAVDAYIGGVLAGTEGRDSIGMSSTPADMLAAAAVAAAWARQEDGHHVRIYDRDVMATDMERHAVENRLRRALHARELDVAYQPIVDLASSEVVGVEALVRWHDPSRGPLSTSAFLPVAEESGLIVPLGNYVRSTAARQVAAWNRDRDREGRPLLGLTANCSALELSAPDFPDRTRAMLGESGLAPELLTIEITESTFVSATANAERAIEELVNLGVRLAIDDFGTGYASLPDLRQSAISSVKIDNSFVAGIGTRPDDEAIVRAAVDFAHTLGARAVAEGIETREQLEYLRRCACDHGQGYYFGKPQIGWRPP